MACSSPDRSEGGFRLYSDDDVGRVRTMQAHLAAGLAAKEAARRALEERRLGDRRRPACRAVEAGAGGRARRLLGGQGQRRARPAARRAQRRRGPARRRAAVPPRSRRGLGARRGQRRAGALREQRPPRPAARARPRLGRGVGAARAARLPAAGTARPRADRLRPRSAQPRLADHLSRARTPRSRRSSRKRGSCGPDRVVVAASDRRAARRRPADLARLARAAPLSIGGAGASAELAEKAGASLLGGDPVSAAELLTRERRASARAQP